MPVPIMASQTLIIYIASLLLNSWLKQWVSD
nr:MAG TPA: hypothetical protein [Caudoviricetes sp.]